MALAEATNHAAPRGPTTARAQEDAPWRLKRPPPGMRPPPLSEVAGPQGCDRNARGTSLGAPSLALPVLAANDTLDSRAVSFLLSRALQKRKEEEVEQRKREVEQRRRGRRYAGQVLLVPDAGGRLGVIESATAQGELDHGSDFVFSESFFGRFAVDDDVLLFPPRLPIGEGLGIPSIHLGRHSPCLPCLPGLTVDTPHTSVYEALGRISHIFPREGALRIVGSTLVLLGDDFWKMFLFSALVSQWIHPHASVYGISQTLAPVLLVTARFLFARSRQRGSQRV